MKTITDIFLEVFNEGIHPGDSFLAIVAEEEIQDIVETGMSYDYFRVIIKKYAEQAIDRCAEVSTLHSMAEFGFDQSNSDVILKVKEELQ